MFYWFKKKIKNINWIIKIHPANIFRDNISLEERLINKCSLKKYLKNIKKLLNQTLILIRFHFLKY